MIDGRCYRRRALRAVTTCLACVVSLATLPAGDPSATTGTGLAGRFTMHSGTMIAAATPKQSGTLSRVIRISLPGDPDAVLQEGTPGELVEHEPRDIRKSNLHSTGR